MRILFCSLVAKSCGTFFATQGTVALGAPLAMEFSRQEYWSGLRFPSSGIFPTQGSNPLYCVKRFWHAFLKAYFGNDCRIDEIEEEIRPFVA